MNKILCIYIDVYSYFKNKYGGIINMYMCKIIFLIFSFYVVKGSLLYYMIYL